MFADFRSEGRARLTKEELRSFLEANGSTFEERDVPYGVQFRCGGGEILTVFNTGRISVQGKETGLASAVKEMINPGTGPAKTATPSRENRPASKPPTMENPVFVVYGHDLQARDNLELLLRRFGLDPIILSQLPAGGDTIIEKLDQYIDERGRAQFACVLLTPD